MRRFFNFSSEETSGQEAKSEERQMSRRRFMKLLGIGAGGIGATLMSGNVKAFTTIDPSFLDAPDIREDGNDTLSNDISGDADTVDNKHADEVRTLPIQMSGTTISAGGSETLMRFNNPTGKKIYIWKAAVSLASGGSDSNLEIEVYNHTDGVSIYKTTNNTLREGSPLASGGSGDDIEIRVDNHDGSDSFTATATLMCTIED